MKKIFTALTLYTFIINSSFASIETDVAKLEKIAMGSSVETAAGKNAEEILLNFYKKEYGDEDLKLVAKEFDEMAYGDEVDQGLTSFISAKKMGTFAVDAFEERLEGMEDKAEIAEVKIHIRNLKTQWADLITSLNNQGAKFGYSGDGPGYCGVSFIKLIIIDEKTGRLYSIYLSESGTC
jgi:hypothetical protein